MAQEENKTLLLAKKLNQKQVDLINQAVENFIFKEANRSVALVTDNGIEVMSGADIIRPAASVLKIVVAIAAIKKAREKELDLDQEVEVSELANTKYPNLIAAFKKDRKLSLQEILNLSLIISDNPAANKIIEVVGIDFINKVINEIGCQHTQLKTAYFDEDIDLNGRENKTNCMDQMKILSALEKDYPDLIDILNNSLRNIRIPLYLPETVPVANKTGTLFNVINDVAIVNADSGFKLAVLTDQQKDPIKTSQDIGKMSFEIFKILNIG